MARPRTVSDAQILDAVRASVLANGARFSLNDVAARVGVSQPALLKRFGTRRQLVLSALAPQRPPWIDVLEAGPDERPFREQLHALVAAIAADMETKVPCLSALRESGISHEELLASMDPSPPVSNLQAVARWLQRAARRKLVDPCGLTLENVAAALIGTVIARAHVAHLLNRSWTRASTPAFTADVVEMFLRVLVPASRRGAP